MVGGKDAAGDRRIEQLLDFLDVRVAWMLQLIPFVGKIGRFFHESRVFSGKECNLLATFTFAPEILV